MISTVTVYKYKHMRQGTADRIYEVVKSIPRGKVMTYGAIALRLRSGSSAGISPRMVGRILHNNPDPENIPCHRVVDAKGKLAEHYAFGGAKEQRRKLRAEGVKFKNSVRVDLKLYLWESS